MSVVVERPVFRSEEYLRELVRRNKGQAEENGVASLDTPPFLPVSAFILDDEIIECEAVLE